VVVVDCVVAVAVAGVDLVGDFGAGLVVELVVNEAAVLGGVVLAPVGADLKAVLHQQA